MFGATEVVGATPVGLLHLLEPPEVMEPVNLLKLQLFGPQDFVGATRVSGAIGIFGATVIIVATRSSVATVALGATGVFGATRFTGAT